MSGCPFDVGDVVVCVDNKPNWIVAEPAVSAFARLKKGATYRVLRVGENDLGKTGVDVGVSNRDLWEGFGDIYPPQVFRKIDDGVTEEFRHAMRSIKQRKTVSA